MYFKCENFQKAGAFKMRGALNAILNIPGDQRSAGVVTHSSGNFGQAVALAAQQLGIPAYIVMPENAPRVKKDAVRGYGGRITECAPNIHARESTADEICKDTGARLLHPSNDIDVILGQGTAAIELIEDAGPLDNIICPVGGGGLLAGTALASHLFSSGTSVTGAEPLNVDDAYRSFYSGQIEYNEQSQTVADGLRTHLGDQNFPLIMAYVDDIFRVEENDIIEAMKLVWQRMKMIIEPSSAVAFAAVLKHKDYFSGKSTGVIISGGNVDLDNLPF